MSSLLPGSLLRRFVIGVLLSGIPVALVHGVMVWVNREDIPDQVELVIPDGTAARVAAGEPVPSIPDGLVFAQGDLLILINHDNETHHLGPAYIPAHSTVSIPIDTAEHFTSFCTFKPSNYLEVQIVPPFTVWAFLPSLLITMPPTLALIILYSFAASTRNT